MKRKELAALLGLSVLSVSLTGCSGNRITQTKTDTQIEVGTECNINVGDYFTLGSKVNVSDIQVDTSSVDTNTVGDYIVNVIYDNNTYNINVSVVDTTAPTITAKSDIEAIERGTEIKPSEYVDIKDASAYSTFFVTEDGDVATLLIPEDLDASVSEINYTIVAVDNSGNRSNEVSVTIPIKASTITLSEDTIVDMKDRDESTFISLEDDSFELEWEQFKAENNITDWTKWQSFFDSLSKEDQEKIMDRYMAKLWNEPAYVYDYSVHALWGSPLWESGYDDNGMRISAVTEKSWTEYKKSNNLNDWKSFKGHMDSIDPDLLIKLHDSFGVHGLTDKENDYIMYILCGIPFDESNYDKDDNFIISSAMSDWAADLVAQSQPSQPSDTYTPPADWQPIPEVDCFSFCSAQPGDPLSY